VNTNNGVKWRRFIVPKKVEQINDHLFIDTYKSNNIKIGVNDGHCCILPAHVHASVLHSKYTRVSSNWSVVRAQ